MLSNKGGMIRDCPLSITNRGQWITQQRLKPNQKEFYSNMHGIDTFVPHFFSRVWGTCIVVTQDIVSEILHVPRVAHSNYPNCARLQTVSKDELLSLFFETPSSWGDRQNTPCSGFVKGPRFLNMVIAFILHPLSHYNSITKPHAPFFCPS